MQLREPLVEKRAKIKINDNSDFAQCIAQSFQASDYVGPTTPKEIKDSPSRSITINQQTLRKPVNKAPQQTLMEECSSPRIMYSIKQSELEDPKNVFRDNNLCLVF